MDRKCLFAQLPQTPPERRWRRQPGPVLVVNTLIRRAREAEEPRYLLINRRHEPYSGKWALVGGKVEFGETVATAAVREVAEETGLVATFVGLRGIVNERLAPAGPTDPAGHFLLFVCAVSAPEGIAREREEGAVAWFTLVEIERLFADEAIIPSDYAMLQQFAGSKENLPYYEAEMIASHIGQMGAAPPQLSRFECVSPAQR